MKSFAHTGTQRNTIFVVLLVWLFALASAVANACLLGTPELQSKAMMGTAAMKSQAPARLLVPVGASTGHHGDADNTKASCLKACDDGARTLPNASSGVDHTDPGPAPLVATLWTGSPHVLAAPRRMDEVAIPIAAPPLWVRYSRLVL